MEFPGGYIAEVHSLISAVSSTTPPQSPSHEDEAPGESSWSELGASMERMHHAVALLEPSGISDVDFVRMMLPHHQAAIDMAKTQFIYGKDPHMRRLAQEIVTDQQSEIELMQRWLKVREPGPLNSALTPASQSNQEQ
jgi:uncharacterized protein (DUF305 family)